MGIPEREKAPLDETNQRLACQKLLALEKQRCHPHMLARSFLLHAMTASVVGIGAVPWRQRVLVTAASVNRGGGSGGGGGGGGGSISGRVEPSSLFFNHHRRQRHRLVLARSFGSLGGEGEGSAHQIASLVLWLRTHGVDFTDRAQFCRVRHMGVGGVATVDFNEGDVIFSLPLYGTLTPGAAAAAGTEGAAGQARETSPLVMTTSLVTSHTGPLGALGRALSVAGLTTTQHVTASSSPSSSHRHGQDTRPRQHHQHHQRPSHRLGGVQESDHDFPLNASHVSLLALGILHQSALGGAVQVESSLPIALERRQVSTLEPMK
jgi:hypothetical protein